MNAEFAGFVTGGGDYAAFIGTAADDHWFAAEVGTIEKLDRDKEGVHIDVENVRDGERREVVCICMERAKSSQVRHEVSLRFEELRNNGVVQFESQPVVSRFRKFSSRRTLGDEAVKLNLNHYADARSAEMTRGIPARSLVTPTFIHKGASRRG